MEGVTQARNHSSNASPRVINGWYFKVYPRNLWGSAKNRRRWDLDKWNAYVQWATTRKPPDQYFHDVEMLTTTPFAVVIHFRPENLNVSPGKYLSLNVQFERVLIEQDYWDTVSSGFHISLVSWDNSLQEYNRIEECDLQFLKDTFSQPVKCIFTSLYISSGGCIFLNSSADEKMQRFLEIVQRYNNRGPHISLD